MILRGTNSGLILSIFIIVVCSIQTQLAFSSVPVLEENTVVENEKLIEENEGLKKQILDLTEKNNELTRRLDNSVSKEYLNSALVVLTLVGVGMIIGLLIQKKLKPKKVSTTEKIIPQLVQLEISNRISKNLAFSTLFYSAAIAFGAAMVSVGVSLSFGLFQSIFEKSDEPLTPAFSKFLDSMGPAAGYIMWTGAILIFVSIVAGYFVIYGQKIKKAEVDLLSRISESYTVSEKAPPTDTTQEAKPWKTMPKDWKP